MVSTRRPRSSYTKLVTRPSGVGEGGEVTEEIVLIGGLAVVGIQSTHAPAQLIVLVIAGGAFAIFGAVFRLCAGGGIGVGEVGEVAVAVVGHEGLVAEGAGG